MKFMVSASVLAALFATNGYADCAKGSQTLFFCNTAKGKQITVCDADKTINYSFGKAGKPELEIKAPRDTSSTFQWHGIGSSISYAVDIPNGNITYNVFWSTDKNDEQHGIEAGVNVFINKELKTTVHCISKGMVNNLEGINLKPSE
jgi:hypothetical protein